MSVVESPAGAKEKVERRLERFYKYWELRDPIESLKQISSGDHLVLFGTDPWERAFGAGAAAHELPIWLATCPPWTGFTVHNRILRGNDDLVYAIDQVEGKCIHDGKEGNSFYRVTSIWERNGDDFEMAHVHVGYDADNR
jgi:ketosteroid isomerase-like protein